MSLGLRSSTGQDFTHRSIVDAHFVACRAEYRRAFDWVGIAPADRVLDAGCGSGLFAGWIAEAVGPDGGLSALDLAGEHVSATRERLRAARWPCPIDVRQGDVLDLPYPDASFDAVWCSNTTQYLDDDQLMVALAEMRRVTRSGGLVAVKELDPTMISVRPGDPFLLADFFRREGRRPGYARQLLRSRDLYRWLEWAGLGAVRQRGSLIEHYAPLEPAVRGFYAVACAQLARRALSVEASASWRRFLDPEDPENPLNDRRAYASEGCVVAVGVGP
jgi:ubiquinone/menaquinone biosynthesis C-methylase UbiE